MKNKVIAILCADIHLQHRPPIWRSAESDWYKAMKRPLTELCELQEKYQCPVLCAGDIFDKWNSPAELINFAMTNLPLSMHCIPGQHDMPEHHPEEIYRSAYASLELADKIITVEEQIISPDIFIQGFPFGIQIKPEPRPTKMIKIALIHEYVWIGKHKYPTAPKEAELSRDNTHNKIYNGKLYGYDIIVYGDNHKGFSTKIGKTTIWNCGTLMRRHSDEIDYKPRVGLLHSNGTIKPHYLDRSQDKYLEISQDTKPEELDMETLYNELKRLQTKDYNFPEEIIKYCRAKKVSKEITEVLIQAMEQEDAKRK
jgi:DNA repair exonuclease SbcCD nuclease subunit